MNVRGPHLIGNLLVAYVIQQTTLMNDITHDLRVLLTTDCSGTLAWLREECKLMGKVREFCK